MSFPCLAMPPATGGEDMARQRRRKEKGGEAKKRRLSDAQVKQLEMSFQDERKLGAGGKARLAADLVLDSKQAAVWFQNRRAGHKSKQVEDAFAVLKTAHDAVVLEKCCLKHQVMELKKKISEVEERTKRLTSGGMAEDLQAAMSAEKGKAEARAHRSLL